MGPIRSRLFGCAPLDHGDRQTPQAPIEEFAVEQELAPEPKGRLTIGPQVTNLPYRFRFPLLRLRPPARLIPAAPARGCRAAPRLPDRSARTVRPWACLPPPPDARILSRCRITNPPA